VREYLVAEYVSRLSVEHAGEALLPHLWYDADWENVAPAALGSSPRPDPCARLPDRGCHTRPDSSLKATKYIRRATTLVAPVASVSEERRDDRQGWTGAAGPAGQAQPGATMSLTEDQSEPGRGAGVGSLSLRQRPGRDCHPAAGPALLPQQDRSPGATARGWRDRWPRARHKRGLPICARLRSTNAPARRRRTCRSVSGG
jgi:hypothetical protein